VAQIGIQILKRCTFRLGSQHFANVYHYSDPTAGAIDYAGLVSEIVTIEKNLHSTDVTFVSAQVWSSGGTPSQNQMQYETTLSGTGVYAANAAMDRERAILMQWPAGLNVLGKPVYLRKWFHSCGAAAAQSFGNPQLQQTAELTQANRDALATEANKLRIIGPTDAWLLCAPSGRLHTGPGFVHKFLEHHQLGDEWR
jgi:hypothetical protein